MFVTKELRFLISKTCVRQPPLKPTLVVDVERWWSYKGTCHVILLAKLHDMYLYKTDNLFHINHYLQSVLKVALLHRFYCTYNWVGLIISYKITWAPSKDFDQPAHSCSLIEFTGILWEDKDPKYLQADRKDWSDCRGTGWSEPLLGAHAIL